jgi:hypothetical protein
MTERGAGGPRGLSPKTVAWAALIVSIASLVASAGGIAGAARSGPSAFAGAARRSRTATHAQTANRGGVVHLVDGKIPARYLPTVANSERLGGHTTRQITPSCPNWTDNLGTWCLMDAPYTVPSADAGLNNYFWASQACVALGGYLPTAAQLIGAANRVKLESTIDDSPVTATIDQNPADGLQDQREMSATLVTVAAGSDAAGSEGVSPGATGNPNTGQPNPLPEPADPQPETLQYVTVYSNHQAGGFAGSEPVSQPENFRCAFNKVPGGDTENTQ